MFQLFAAEVLPGRAHDEAAGARKIVGLYIQVAESDD
jgi:hypothetical protein